MRSSGSSVDAVLDLAEVIRHLEKEVEDLERDLEAARDDLSNAEAELESQETLGGRVATVLDDQIHRLYVLGLDTEMSTLEVLERLRDRVAA